MGDVFNEQLVKTIPNFKKRMLRYLIIMAAGIITFIALIWLSSIGVLIGFAVCFGAYYALSFLNVEYEYIFTNGDLDIDIIYSRARRKRIFNTNVKQFDIMCHVEDKMRIGEFTGAEVTLDFSSGTVNENTYAFLVLHKGKRTKVIFEPNTKMMKAISSVLTRRKLFIKQ